MKYGKLQIKKIYWTTKEVSELTGVPDYTLQYWEKVVPYLQVPRNRAKKRAWRMQDIEFVKALKEMLNNEKKSCENNEIPVIVSHEPFLEDGAELLPIKSLSPNFSDSPPLEKSSFTEKKIKESHKPDRNVLLKLRSELLLAMSKLQQ